MSEAGAADAAVAAQDSPAFPRAARMLAVILLADLVLLGLWQAPKLMQAEWSATGLVVFATATVMVLWMGTWIVRSRTRLLDGELSQTWVWTKRVRVADVASLKLVHLPWLERIVAPRLLVRRRGGGVTWFHSADPQLLIAFSLLVAQQHMPAQK
ncbi:hypothetical protein [Pseudorhodoferax sp.]|uniref:hypothetical protein n=1 Tax=Pseudorhodoferax sp. TaxID=1993553 RepID=UPI002DD6A6AA|nr:hypothetical protein [Pseudorhodoferax sp.]